MTIDSGEPENFEGPNGNTAIIGEGPDAGHPVSMKALQAIYNEITGKAEELAKYYDSPFKATFADIEQLHLKVTQACEQYHVESSNAIVTLYHLDDTKEVFSSFERFRLYNKSSASAIESIILKYNLLIVLPKTKKAQSYTLSIRLASRIAVMKHMRRDVLPVGGNILRFMIQQTAIVSVTYVDYMVARNLLSIVDSWFEALDVSKTPALLRFLRKMDWLLIAVGGYGLGALTLILALRILPFQVTNASSLQDLARFLLLALSAMFFTYRYGRFFGRIAEESLHSWQELAYLSLNRGDEKEIDSAKAGNQLAIVRGLASLFSAFLMAVLTKIVATYLTQ